MYRIHMRENHTIKKKQFLIIQSFTSETNLGRLYTMRVYEYKITSAVGCKRPPSSNRKKIKSCIKTIPLQLYKYYS